MYTLFSRIAELVSALSLGAVMLFVVIVQFKMHATTIEQQWALAGALLGFSAGMQYLVALTQASRSFALKLLGCLIVSIAISFGVDQGFETLLKAGGFVAQEHFMLTLLTEWSLWLAGGLISVVVIDFAAKWMKDRPTMA